MRRHHVRLIAACLATALSSSVAAWAECLVVFPKDPVLRLKESKYVYLAQVTDVVQQEGGYLRVTRFRVVRGWRGKKKKFEWSVNQGTHVGEYYLVFANEEPEWFPPECGNAPLPLAGALR